MKLDRPRFGWKKVAEKMFRVERENGYVKLRIWLYKLQEMVYVFSFVCLRILTWECSF